MRNRLVTPIRGNSVDEGSSNTKRPDPRRSQPASKRWAPCGVMVAEKSSSSVTVRRLRINGAPINKHAGWKGSLRRSTSETRSTPTESNYPSDRPKNKWGLRFVLNGRYWTLSHTPGRTPRPVPLVVENDVEK